MVNIHTILGHFHRRTKALRYQKRHNRTYDSRELTGGIGRSPDTMQYRFVTPHRRGKWYPSIEIAQENAVKIGAGFFDGRNGKFYQYRESRVETRRGNDLPAMTSLPVLYRQHAPC